MDKILNNPKRFITFILLLLVFPIIYTQSPLFTSNQNQYFLHGLAHANYGFLYRDWLANTIDPTPLFSLIVEWTYRILHFNVFYYLYYAILMGVYLFSIIGIIFHEFDFKEKNIAIFIFITLLLLINSEAFRVSLYKLFGDNWRYIFEDGVADQRLLGPVFQPSSFGAFLLLAIFSFQKAKPFLAVFFAVLAASIHPTYLLSAGSLTIAYIIIIFYKEHDIKKAILLGTAALLAVSPIVIYVWLNIANTNPDIRELAQSILINFRIPHHALIPWWFDASAVFKIGLIAFSLFLIRRKKLLWILLPPSLIALVLTIIQYLTNNTTLALIFPWRITTFIVPLATSIILAHFVSEAANKYQYLLLQYSKWVYTFGILVIIIAAFAGLVKMKRDFKQKKTEQLQEVYEFVQASSNSDDTYLIPIKMQDFRLISGAPAYVDFKSIPYQADEVVEWYRRVELAKRFEKQGDCDVLEEILSNASISWIIVKQGAGYNVCPEMEIAFNGKNYLVFRIK